MGARKTGYLSMRSRFAIGLLVAVSCALGPVLGQAASGHGNDSRITLAFKDVAVAQAVETLAELTGHAIEVRGPIENRQVMLILRDATLEESLERILEPWSFVIEWAEDWLTIRLLGDASERVAGFDGSDDVGEAIVSYPAGQTSALPPGMADEFPVTIADLESAAVSKSETDISDLEAFPPGPSGEPSVTNGELESTSTSQPDISDLRAFPPGAPDEIMVTIRELERTAASTARPDISTMAAFPPGPPDEIPVTIGELEQTATSTAPPDISNMEAFPPGAPDEIPITIEDLEEALFSTGQPDANDIEAFPPPASPD